MYLNERGSTFRLTNKNCFEKYAFNSQISYIGTKKISAFMFWITLKICWNFFPINTQNTKALNLL